MKVIVEGSQRELVDNRDSISQSVSDLLDEALCDCTSALEKGGNSTAWGNHPKAAINDLRRIWVEGYHTLLGEMVQRLSAVLEDASPDVGDAGQDALSGIIDEMSRHKREGA